MKPIHVYHLMIVLGAAMVGTGLQFHILAFDLAGTAAMVVGFFSWLSEI